MILFKRDIQKAKDVFMDEFNDVLSWLSPGYSNEAMQLLNKLCLLHDLFIFSGKEYLELKKKLDSLLAGEDVAKEKDKIHE